MTISISYLNGSMETIECRMVSGYPTRNADGQSELIIYFPEPVNGRINRYIQLETVDNFTILR